MSTLATILATSIAISAATRGHIAPPPPPTVAAQRPEPVCLYQIPGEMQWVNLYLMESLTVKDTRETRVQRKYVTTIFMASRISYTIEMAPGQDISTHSNAILKRINECKAGE